jgi:hypothetical protein
MLTNGGARDTPTRYLGCGPACLFRLVPAQSSRQLRSRLIINIDLHKEFRWENSEEIDPEFRLELRQKSYIYSGLFLFLNRGPPFLVHATR